VKTLSPSTILALLSLPRFGRKTVRTLLMRFRDDTAPTPADDLRAFLDTYAPQQELDRLTIDRALAAARETMEEAARVGINVLTMFDDAFPALLRDIPDPPILLFVKGSVKALRGLPTVAVIGTREPTEYGERSAQKLGKRFAERGFVVVSGLAKGCDAFAHEGCVEAGGIGVAVLAHGLDTVYPAENRPLAERLLASGGCLVSEYPLGMRAHRSHFVERDRLQSGLSRGVVVVETDVKGGTMHTVGFAQEQHRCLACVAHPPKYLDQPKVQGNQHLLKRGEAVPLADASDLDRFASALLGDKSAVAQPEKIAARNDKNGQGSFW
jgi:DNA processing protein